MAFTLRQIERFEITLGPSTTLFDHTLATTLLDTSKTFLLYGWRSDSNDADSEYGSCRIISASQIRAERSGPASSITFIGYVCEFTAGVAVFRGSTSMFSGPNDVNVSSVITDLSKSWCRAHQRDQGGGGTVERTTSRQGSWSMPPGPRLCGCIARLRSPISSTGSACSSTSAAFSGEQ